MAFRAVSLASALCGFDVARARYLLAAPETVLLLRTLSLFLLIFIVVSCFFFLRVRLLSFVFFLRRCFALSLLYLLLEKIQAADCGRKSDTLFVRIQ